MSIRPIEPGCLAIVISGPQAGEGCEVICWVDHGHVFNTRGFGCVNDTGVSGWAVDFGDGCGVYRPGRLLRIDDHGEDADDYEVIREEWGITA